MLANIYLYMFLLLFDLAHILANLAVLGWLSASCFFFGFVPKPLIHLYCMAGFYLPLFGPTPCYLDFFSQCEGVRSVCIIHSVKYIYYGVFSMSDFAEIHFHLSQCFFICPSLAYSMCELVSSLLLPPVFGSPCNLLPCDSNYGTLCIALVTCHTPLRLFGLGAFHHRFSDLY